MDDALDDGSRPRRLRRLKKLFGFVAIPLAIVVCMGGVIGGLYWLPDDLFGGYSAAAPTTDLPVDGCLGELPAEADRSPLVVDCRSTDARYRVAGFESGGVRGLDRTEDICGSVDHDRIYRHRERDGVDIDYCLADLKS
jgi:hypothetical protein